MKSSSELALALDEIASSIIGLSNEVAQMRVQNENEVSKSDNPNVRPVPTTRPGDHGMGMVLVTLPDSPLSLSETRLWLGDVQSALVAADKKLRMLAAKVRS